MNAVIVIALLYTAGLGTAVALCREPARQAVVLSVYGLVLAVLFVVLGAPDVALSQIGVGAVITPLMVLFTYRKTRRRGDE